MAVEIPVHVDIEGAFADAAKRVKVAMMPLEQTIEGLTSDLGAWREILNESKINDASFIEAAKNIQRISERLAEADYEMKKYTENAGSIRSMTSTLAELERKWAEMGSAQKYAGEGGKELSTDAQDLVRQYKEVSAQILKEGQSLQQLAAQEEKINSLRGRGTKIRQTEDRILRNEVKTIRILTEQYRILSERIQRAPVGSEQFKSLSAELQRVSAELKKAQAAANGTKGAIESTGAASDKARTSLNATNQTLRRQSTLWMQLKSLAGMYISVFGGLRFLDNIRKTTAELEMQRIALGSLIQDTDKANDLFRQIKAAALKSPFEIKDLVTYTKQLSAYQIETEKLFDTTRKLADVSAGLGVDMNRLILAYGQVRAASVLRGQELRQFTEAGIPLVDKLAEKFEKLGREGTTTADVFELISKRAVPFSMIEEIFDEMTDAGGMFYKMQEKQSETLQGQWMKLRDAVTIMYDEIGNTEQVHRAMEDLIQNALSLTRSWREISRWVAAGTASLLAYSVVAKSTAISSASLAKTEAMRLAVSKKQVVQTPPIIAALMSEKGAKDLSRIASKRLMVAQYQLSTANNILSKTFLKLRVAILKNPYAAAAAAIVALGAGIYALVKNSQEAKVSVESLHDSIAKVQDAAEHASEARRLIQVYEELSQKATLTAEEQEKLSRVTRELAKTYPTAVNALNEETGALDINIKKVKELAAAEVALASIRLKKQAEGAEQNIEELEAEAKRLSDNIISVQKNGGLYKGRSVWSGKAIFQSVSEETLGKWGERLREITTLIYDYKRAQEELQNAEFIGPMPSESHNVTAQLKTWKKAISDIQAEKVAAGATQLFTPDDISKFESVVKFSKVLKEKEEEITQSLKTNYELRKTATEETKESIQSDIDADEATLKMIQAIKTALGIMFKQSSGRDNRLSQLKSDISELTNAYKKFQELRKYKSTSEALIDINTLFPQLNGKVPSLTNTVSQLESMLADVKAKLAKSPKSKTLLEMQRTLETEISNLKFDELKDGIERQLTRLSEEIKRSETARNFYKDIFDLTGDESLATSMSIEVYGGIGDEFKERLQKQLNTVLSNIDADADMTKAFGEQDFGYILDHLSEIPEKWHKEIKDLADAQQKFSADQIKTWLNELKRAKTYGEERIQIARTTQQLISKINASNLADEEKKSLVAQYARKEAEDVAKLQYEAFKDSPMYVQMFSDLDNATQGMLRSMRNRITELMESWKDLDPVQLKEMQSRLQEIDAQLAKKNPFKVLSDSIKRYNELMDEGRSMRGDELKLVSADANLKQQQDALELAVSERDAKRATYDYAVETYGANSAAARVAKQNLDIADQAAVAQGEVTDEAKKSADAAARNAGEWKDILKNIANARDEIAGYASVISDLGGAIEKAMSAFVSDNAAEYARRSVEVFGTFADALQKVALSAAQATAGDVAGALQSGSQGIIGMVSAGIQLSDLIAKIKLDKWNDQMTEQDKIIQSLEHSYDRLSRAIERSFGSDYLYNYNEAMDILLAQQEAYLKQAEIQADVAQNASRKSDREAAAEQEKQLRQTAADVDNQISDLREKMQEFYAGTSLTSAAEAFADAWLDAYRQFGSTTDAIKEKMEDMINNLIVKSSLAKVAETVLQPFYDAISEAARSQTLIEDVPALIGMLQGKTAELNNSLNAMGQILRASGINLRGTVGNLSGISRDIASASEESILALAAGINTQNFYMSYVPTISADLKMIAEIMSAGSGQVTSTTVTPEGAVMPSIQEMVYDHLPNIDRNLSEIYRLVSNVIKPRGTSAPYYIATDV